MRPLHPPPTPPTPNTTTPSSGSWFFEALRNFNRRHERLKKAVHEGWRVPLPREGQIFMGFVYFSIPCIAGYYVMKWAERKSLDNIGDRGDRLPARHQHKLRQSLTAVGDMRSDGKKIGAGGWGGGVNLAVSDRRTQERNNEKLNRFIEQQQQRTLATKVRKEDSQRIKNRSNKNG